MHGRGSLFMLQPPSHITYLELISTFLLFEFLRNSTTTTRTTTLTAITMTTTQTTTTAGHKYAVLASEIPEESVATVVDGASLVEI